MFRDSSRPLTLQLEINICRASDLPLSHLEFPKTSSNINEPSPSASIIFNVVKSRNTPVILRLESRTASPTDIDVPKWRRLLVDVLSPPNSLSGREERQQKTVLPHYRRPLAQRPCYDVLFLVRAY